MCINIAEKEIGSYLDRWSHVSVDRSRNRTTRRIEHTKKVILVRARLIVHTNYRPHELSSTMFLVRKLTVLPDAKAKRKKLVGRTNKLLLLLYENETTKNRAGEAACNGYRQRRSFRRRICILLASLLLNCSA